MDQNGWRLTCDELKAWIADMLAADRVVIAPVARAGGFQFERLSKADDMVLSRTQWSPKEFFLPRTETLYSYNLTHDDLDLEDQPSPNQRRVLFGVRPCDVMGVRRLVDVFTQGDVVDPFVAERWAATTVVSTVCVDAEDSCFCTAVGGSPEAADDVDVQLFQIDDDFLVKPLSQQGEELTSELAKNWSDAQADDWETVKKSVARVEAQIKEKYPADFTQVAAELEARFDSDDWADLSEMCVSCSICAYVCPSCSCFDVYHETTALEGSVRRSWDSCSFDVFTRHASGHNPRSGNGSRLRQRVLHKFAYKDPDHPELTRCVGCGRCTSLCPAGIHIYQIVDKILEKVPEDAS